jgi:hypothetical protein
VVDQSLPYAELSFAGARSSVGKSPHSARTSWIDINGETFQGARADMAGMPVLVAKFADPPAVRSGRDFAAWIGLVPRQNSSGGKDKLGSISKQGIRHRRSLFTPGALAAIRYAKILCTEHWPTLVLASGCSRPQRSSNRPRRGHYHHRGGQ